MPAGLLGRDVTLVNPSQPTRDPDHGDMYWASETTTDTQAVISFRGSPSYASAARGVDITADAIAQLSDEHVTNGELQTGDDSDDKAATRITSGTNQLETVLVVRRLTALDDDGTVHAFCELED